MVVGAGISIAVACAMNLVVTPLYTPISVSDVAAMILPILLPFNALKMAINVIAGQALLGPCLNVIDPMRAGTSGTARRA